MSPEQATATRELDGRSDLYALGCVLYEMLAGQPPFVGATAQQLLARHAIDPVPPLRTVRATVPARRGAERDARARQDPGRPLPHRRRLSPRRWPRRARLRVQPSRPRRPSRRAGAGWSRWRPRAGSWLSPWRHTSCGRSPRLALDPNLVAVVPFRVRGAAPALGYLREGMIDLVAARLTGEGGARAADPGSVMAAWRRAAGSEADDLPERAALGLARRLGAGQLLVGGVVGTPDHVALNASLLPVAGREPAGRREGRRRRGQPAPAGGSADRPAHHRGNAERRTGSTAWSTRRFRRCGSTSRLRRRIAAPTTPTRSPGYGQALDLDSTFALAGLRLASAAGWTAAPGAGRRGLERAWRSRDRLSPRDQALLMAEVGPDYPAVSTAGAASGRVGAGGGPRARPGRSGGTSWATCTSTKAPICRSSRPGGGRRTPSAGRRRWTRARRRWVTCSSSRCWTARHRRGAAPGRPLPGPRHERRAAGLLPLAHRRGSARRPGAGRTARAVPADGAAEPVADHEPRGARRPPAGGRGVGRRRHPRQGGAELRLAAQQDLPARLRDQPRPSLGGAGGHGPPG